MEPRIQYAQTADGVSIAFWTLGEGMPLVSMSSPPFTHIQLESQMPEWRPWYEGLARRRRVVRYDGRGSGLSDRDVTDYSVDALVLDLESVVDRLNLEQFALLAYVDSGPVAITYVARHQDRVSDLVLWCTYARGSDILLAPEMPGLFALMDKDWRLFTNTVAHALLGWSEGELAHRLGEFLRECTTPEAVQAVWQSTLDCDLTTLLPQVRSRTLVLHPRNLRWLPLDVARSLASQIPDARLTLLEGAAGGPWGEDAQPVLEAIDEFLGEGEEAEAAERLAKEDVHTILFTDMEGSTTLTQRLGDAKAQEMLRTHNRVVRDALRAHGGSEIKHTGDGIMASFSSAARALECAIAMQRAFAKHNETAEEPIGVRMGLNAGEPVAEEEDLFGTAVQLAARVCGRAEPGQILACNVVRELAAGKGFLLSDQGDVVLRGFEDPVRLYEVRWREA